MEKTKPSISSSTPCVPLDGRFAMAPVMKSGFQEENPTIRENAPGSQINCINGGGATIRTLRPKCGLLTYCREIIINRMANGHVKCSICDRNVLNEQIRDIRQIRILVDHAFMHFPKSVFSCQLCACRFKTRAAMRFHLQKRHNISFGNRTCEDNRDKYADEIKAIIDRCYTVSDPYEG